LHVERALEAMAPQLRPYQIEAQKAIVDARERGTRRQLVSMATGLGKTVVIATLPQLLKVRPNDVTLIIAHRDELIRQIAEKMHAANPDAMIGTEKAELRADERCSIVVATVQTLAGKRLEEFIARFGRRISLFVIDEAHHAAAPTYRAIVDAILESRPDAAVIGFTATPNRGDGVRLVDVFHEIVYTMDARAAIDSGYLVPVRSFAIATRTNLDDVASRAGDFVIGQLAQAVNTKERNARIVDAYRRHTPNAKALVFAASVEHARDIADVFVAAGVEAAFASGETAREERERIIRDFRADRVKVLVNCGLYLEGFDVPSIEVVINARPTKSTTLYTQITGRGLRPVDEIASLLSATPSTKQRCATIAESSKPYAIVLDLVDQAHRHAIVTLPTLWGLPLQIDAQGRPVSLAAAKYEELCLRDPKLAARVRTFDEIETALISLDEREEAGTRIPPGVWHPLTPEHWRFHRPAELIARDRSGNEVSDLAEKYETLLAEARRIAPKEDAAAFARRMLEAMYDVDIKSSSHREAIRIDITRRSPLFVASLTVGEQPPRDLCAAPELVEVIAEAEKRLESGLGVTTQPHPLQDGNARHHQPTHRKNIAKASLQPAQTGVATHRRRRRPADETPAVVNRNMRP
jgi:superfamily II DNA or RNA helicase